MTNFCKTGTPNGEGLPAWQPSGKAQKKVLHMGEQETHMGNPSTLKLIKIMLTNKAVGE